MMDGNSRDYEITIEKLISNGSGLGRIEGKPVFVPFTIPGERVLVSIVEEKKGYDLGRIVKILSPSEKRRTPPCQYFMVCGGCSLQHMEYGEQIRNKKELYLETFRRIAKINIESEIPVITGKEFGYRNRARFHLNREKKAGFKGRGGGIVPIRECIVCDSGINHYLSKLSSETGVAGSGSGFSLFSDGTSVYNGSLEKKVAVPVSGSSIVFDPSGFFQSNLSLLSDMAAWVLEGLSGAAAYDLYCGSGLFAHFLQDNFAKTYAVESDPIAAAGLEYNLRLSSCRIVKSTVEQFLTRRRSVPRPDVIIVDPPRNGLSKDVRKQLKKILAEKIIYVSCNPATLSRDVKEFVESGYAIGEIRIFDFFPQTEHIESVVKLELDVKRRTGVT